MLNAQQKADLDRYLSQASEEDVRDILMMAQGRADGDLPNFRLIWKGVPGAPSVCATSPWGMYTITRSDTQPYGEDSEVWAEEFFIHAPEGYVIFGAPNEDDLPLARCWSDEHARIIAQAHVDAGAPTVDVCPDFRPLDEEEDTPARLDLSSCDGYRSEVLSVGALIDALDDRERAAPVRLAIGTEEGGRVAFATHVLNAADGAVIVEGFDAA